MTPSLPKSLLAGRELAPGQLASIEELNKLPQYRGLVDDITESPEAWNTFMDHPTAETVVPCKWLENSPGISKTAENAMKMVLIQALRPDRVIAATQDLIGMTLAAGKTGGQFDLG